jgi:hypothetical protein
MVDHSEIVATVKRELEARGVDLSGACGAFQITKRVAWRLRGEGAGLLSKPGGNNCEGYSVDIVAYPGGVIFDMLGSSGGANNPQWLPSDAVDPERYRPAIDPGDEAPAAPPAPAAAPAVDLSGVLAALDTIHRQQDNDRELVLSEIRGLRQDVTDALKKYGPALVAGQLGALLRGGKAAA